MKGVSFIGYSSSISLMLCGLNWLGPPAQAWDIRQEFDINNPVTTIPCQENSELDTKPSSTGKDSGQRH